MTCRDPLQFAGLTVRNDRVTGTERVMQELCVLSANPL